MRVTWMQPEDVLPHEFVASREEGRDVADLETRWLTAGGAPLPPPGGASNPPASPELRALAWRLLEEIEARPAPRNVDEPDDLESIRALWPRAGSAEPPRSDEPSTQRSDLADRVHGAWLGRAVGCLLG